MPIYKRRVTKKGKETFFQDGKEISRALFPIELMDAEPGMNIMFEPKEIQTQTATEAKAKEDKEWTGHLSDISGEPATRRRWLNQKVYWLTEEEYQKYNLGKLSQLLRKKADAETVAE